MFSDAKKQSVLHWDKSNKIMFSDTEKKDVLLSVKSNNIMFSGTGKQNFSFLTRAIR